MSRAFVSVSERGSSTVGAAAAARMSQSVAGRRDCAMRWTCGPHSPSPQPT
ncbi:hypothetical protein [Streptomyces sp. NEAU-S7GS2]|uniref:hypothetical protein n=1 Tax=Streptomyces sp. NEAU-S7GS2 TaxID=2202000 RepID=UPI001EF5B7A7|nr:hypothetical protein [Streptomyces sp. NEAU-S7GS2]